MFDKPTKKHKIIVPTHLPYMKRCSTINVSAEKQWIGKKTEKENILMKTEKLTEKALRWLFTKYLTLLEKTVKINWHEENEYGESQIFGFWHEDSFFMNLVLERLADKTTPVDVIVTADTRGNYIEHMIKRCGGNALRVPDGYKAFGALKNIVRDSYEKAHSIAVALDGPLGPRHEPKKLAFYLSEHAEEAFVGISLSYSSCIRLTRRWDKYVIPLPFTTVDVAVKDYGIVQKKAIPNLPVNADAASEEIYVAQTI
jgi:lysophospholipid acyltransferase (LPLAT)-like uncharacterized protein